MTEAPPAVEASPEAEPVGARPSADRDVGADTVTLMLLRFVPAGTFSCRLLSARFALSLQSWVLVPPMATSISPVPTAPPPNSEKVANATTGRVIAEAATSDGKPLHADVM